MAAPWSPAEVAATVADYLAMLDAELRGVTYSKAEHNRRLQQVLDDRSRGAIEFKHCNISAVMIELGLPYISGYQPRWNYQQLLKEEIEARLQAAPQLVERVQTLVEEPASVRPTLVDPSGVIVPRPTREKAAMVRERPLPGSSAPARINYLERETRNASLGLAGEEFVLELEEKRLLNAGAKRLAGRIEHVARSRGDGLGYDILSFEPTGEERLIEVKTTRFGQFTPFFASQNEVDVSARQPDEYRLYRVFDFDRSPRLFIVPGSLRDEFDLTPTQYRAFVA